MSKSSSPFGLGVYTSGSSVYLYYNKTEHAHFAFRVDQSENGFDFAPTEGDARVIDYNRRIQDTMRCRDFRVSQLADGSYVLTFKYAPRTQHHICVATSTDLKRWKKLGDVDNIADTAVIVPSLQHDGKHIMYFGDKDIRVAYSADLLNWTISDAPVLTSQYADLAANLILAMVEVKAEGIFLYYYVHSVQDGLARYAVSAVLLDKADPTKILWKSPTPVIHHIDGFEDKSFSPVGIVDRETMLISYWDIHGEGVVAVAHPKLPTSQAPKVSMLKLLLNKLQQNPILKPLSHNAWESKATFNPAAIYDNGKVHLIYRAVGHNDISVLGYATSSDGETVDERFDDPIYVPSQPFECNPGGGTPGEVSYNDIYASGSAYGGCEDPRITKIDDKFYITYVAYDGCNPPRVAMSSILVKDFYAHKWDKWKTPVLISRPGVVDKNACILPEKINGKYVVFHRIFPNILVDYVDSLEAFDGKTVWLKGEHAIRPREQGWDSRKVGIGPTPLKTELGWLVIYHAVDDRDAGKYKMGAMVLDLNDPTKVLFRSNDPIIEPDMHYENEGHKAGVAYPCGAVIKDGELIIYYGGADMVTCAAKANLNEFLYHLSHNEHVQLLSVKQMARQYV